MSLSVIVFLAVAHLEAVCIPPFSLCVRSCVWACVSVFECVFFSSSATLPVSRSMPGSEVVTTESLRGSLMWCTTQMHAHTRTRAHMLMHAHTPRSSQDKQPSHLGPCASVCTLSQGADSQGEKARPGVLLCFHVRSCLPHAH